MSLRTTLVIEDDSTCSELLEMVLQSIPGVCVDRVRSGSQARKRLASDQPYSLVITDFHLPGEDGLSLMEAIHEMPGRNQLPFVLVTSSREPDIRRRAEAMGARGFFEKPFSPAQLRNAVHSILDGL